MTEEKHFPNFNFGEGEVLLIDKPYRWTSFDVVGKIRNAIKPSKIKVGHAGTLDPLATGLLVLCTGKLTKTIEQLQAQEKEYTGTFIIGATTPSYDAETEIDNYFDISELNEAEIYQATHLFIGDTEQYPPIHSAIKMDGERLYEKARRGEQVELRPRYISIKTFEITNINLPEIHFRVICSKGTYIRSLANDFGKALGNGAYLSTLRRIRSGDFHVDNAFKVMELVNHIRSKNEKKVPSNEAEK